MSAIGTKVGDVGRVCYTVVKRSGNTGIYDITFNAAYPRNNYVYMVTPIGALVSVTLGAETSSTKMSACTYTRSGALTDGSFSFTAF